MDVKVVSLFFVVFTGKNFWLQEIRYFSDNLLSHFQSWSYLQFLVDSLILSNYSFRLGMYYMGMYKFAGV